MKLCHSPLAGPRIARLPLFLACLLPILANGLFPAGAQAQELPGWTLVWADEFDGPSIDSSKWSHEVNGAGGGNNELQYYTARATNSFIENGHLVIQALKETYTGPDGTRNYTSARMRTLNKGDWTYGRFESRMKLPYGQGLWPAFWMLPTDWVYGGWAASGEIDIMEIIGSEPDVLHGTIHYHGEWPDNRSSGASWTLPSGDFSDDFHVFALEWEEGVMRWYVDGIHYSTKTSWDSTSAPYPAPFDQRFHILLNVAVGGNWPGDPDPTTVFPQQMVVDYVRVYARSLTPPPTGTNVLANPGFESSLLGPWVGYSPGGANNLGTYVQSTNDTYYNGGNPGGDHVLTHSGNYVGKIYGDFTGGENFNGCYQDIPAEPGSLWSADGWALTHAQDLMQAPNTTWIEVTFRNASDTILALYRSEVLNRGNVSVSSWMHLLVTNQLSPSTFVVTNTGPTLTAPAGTTKARYQLVFRQLGYDDGAMYYDDLNLVLQPVAVPVTLSAALVGSNIQISFPTQNGVDYGVAYKTNLTDLNWIPIETVAGDGTTMTVSYPANSPTRFYTIQAP
jgi:beta-glucanase (GH16 family)